jgi:hypothetical protein
MVDLDGAHDPLERLNRERVRRHDVAGIVDRGITLRDHSPTDLTAAIDSAGMSDGS